jgi:L-ascorbate metabolism protein UlaG (beta-lactamase superfamily)
MQQTNILFDPIYSKRASPFQWIGPKRVRNPGITLNNLPRIDAVLISHNHYDHMDMDTLRYLEKIYHPIFVVPLGNKKALQADLTHVIELDWWQTIQIKQIEAALLPARHSSRRGLFDYNKTLWGSYGLKAQNKSFYFAGDTGYAPHFKAIRKHWGQPDFAFIPIGAYQPRSLLKHDHMDPLEAVQSHLDLGSRTSMGIHWGTFQLSAESIDQPIKDLARARQDYHVPETSFFIIQEGVPFYIAH